MSKFQELAIGYAQRIKEAIVLDGFNSRFKITAEDLRNSRTLKEAKKIKLEIDRLIYTQSKQSISEDDKLKIWSDPLKLE